MELSVFAELVAAMTASHSEPMLARALHRSLEPLSIDAVTLDLEEPLRTFREGRGNGPKRTMALADTAGRLGQLVLAVRAGATAPSSAVLECVARLTTAALRNVALVGRVAAISRRAHGESRQLREELELALPASVVAITPLMRRLFGEIVPLVARQDSTVLVRGETGTGKEIVARRIHELSPRARRPFVAINCGAIPRTLAESALFGHEKGAFSGAEGRRLGVFERAHGGTLFLDEVGELPLDVQVKLLRVLETGQLERVGGERVVRVDARVVAATHRDLEERVTRKKFRADLLYRLDVFPIVLPPLRDRRDDIEPLAARILERLAARMGRPTPTCSRASMERLRDYPWPGNIRELENVLERSLLLSPAKELVLTLPESIAKRDRTYRAASKRWIEDALATCAGRIYGPNGAAEMLGLKPTTLQSKMLKLGIAR